MARYAGLLLALASLAPVSVRFSPGGGCTAEVVAQVARAQSAVRVLAYAFTSEPIGTALIAARQRGVDVQVVLDARQSTGRGSQLARLRGAGIATVLDGRHAIMHEKVVIVDAAVVLTGSFNLTGAAEHANAENLVTIEDPKVAARYLENWAVHAAHGRPVAAWPSPQTIDPPRAAR